MKRQGITDCRCGRVWREGIQLELVARGKVGEAHIKRVDSNDV